MSLGRFITLTIVLLATACAIGIAHAGSPVELQLKSGHRITGDLIPSGDRGPLLLVTHTGSTRILRRIPSSHVRSAVLNRREVTPSELRRAFAAKKMTEPTPIRPYRIPGYSTIADFVDELLGLGKPERPDVLAGESCESR